MKTVVCCYVLLVLGFATTWATAAEWQTDYDKALAIAKAEHKPVFITFTGSDWCGPCIAMDKQVFSQREFLDYADKHIVLLDIDYPKTKLLSGELRKQNERLKYQFKINKRGYPTIALIDSTGQVLGVSTGYDDEKPADIIARIEMWVKHPTRDTEH